MDINNFLEKIENLSSDSVYKPHKYVLLLTVLDIIESQKLKENKIYFDDSFKKCFTSHFNKYSREEDRNRPYTPFFHLQSSGFWFLKPLKGRELELASIKKAGGPRDIYENVDYAYLSEAIYKLFSSRDTSTIIRHRILDVLNRHIKEGDEFIVRETKSDYEDNMFSKSLFKHEETAINQIGKLTNLFGKMLSNIYLYDRQSNSYYEYDIVLITHLGIHVIELKHWSGNIEIAPYKWIINDVYYRNDPHKANNFKCKILKSIYQHNFKTYPDIWIESVVVLTNQDATVTGYTVPGSAAEKNIPNPTFASITEFISYLKKKQSLTNSKLLDSRQMEAIFNYIVSLDNPRQRMNYSIPGYETVEYVSQKQECVELIARSVESKAKGLKRFRVFRTPQNVSQAEKERFVKKAYNTLSSVEQIGDHPHVLKVWVIKNDEGDIIEGSEWSETGTLRDFLHEYGDALPVDTALNICRGAALALHKAHQVDVIHRAVKPENILIMNEIPKLMNFDLAYQLEDNRITVLTDINRIKDDGYIAPELLLGQDIDEGTDYFNLGVMAYELLTGEKPFSSTRAFLAQGGILSAQALERLENTGITGKIVSAINNMVCADWKGRLKDGEQINSVFDIVCEDGQVSSEPVAINQKLQPGDTYDVYEIQELIGQGAAAQIYKATTIRGKKIALKLFNKEIPLERIVRESDITSTVQSTYVVHCDNKIGHWKNDRYFLVMDYIEGETLRELIERQEIPDQQTFRSIALCLLEAVEAFHGHKDEQGNRKVLLHSDIKPDNVIISGGKLPILVDCGIAGEERVDVYQGSSGYVPPDSIRGTDMMYSVDGDLFALGITLWEWLLGQKPYENPAVGDIPRFPVDLNHEVSEELRGWLTKAVATSADKRFTSVYEMRDALVGQPGSQGESSISGGDVVVIQEDEEGTVERVTTDTVPCDTFVGYLNTLSNASAGNENATAESQVVNDQFDKIFVHNPLADFVYNQLFKQQYSVVLTGNAGDGKTTIAFHIVQQVTGKKRALKPIDFIQEHNLFIVKDMSELEENERVRILAETIQNGEQKKYLIVSNTGVLLESYKKLNDYGINANDSDILKVLEADNPDDAVLHHRLQILNIGRLDSIQTAVKVFKRMLEPENWELCADCTVRDNCPLQANVKLLQDNLPLTSQRVGLLYRRLYEYNTRLTMRQMTGHLAYSITAGRDCSDIKAMNHIDIQKSRLESYFFNSFFGDSGESVIPEAMQLLPIRRVRKDNYGSLLDPSFEKRIWLKEGKGISVYGKAGDVYQRLLDNYDYSDPKLRRQVRRLAYFFFPSTEEDVKQFVSIFLQSPMLLKYMRFAQADQIIPPLQERNHRNRIMQVFQEHLVGMRLPEGSWQADNLYITLNKGTAGSATQIILADFRIDDFELTVYAKKQAGSGNRSSLYLRHKRSGIDMELDLPYLDYVERRYNGEVAEDLSAFYSDRLEKFKVELLNYFHDEGSNDKQSLRLLRIGADRKFVVMQVIISDELLEVL